jgi:hypothetical protein
MMEIKGITTQIGVIEMNPFNIKPQTINYFQIMLTTLTYLLNALPVHC